MHWANWEGEKNQHHGFLYLYARQQIKIYIHLEKNA